MFNSLRKAIHSAKAKREAVKLAGMAFQAENPDKDLCSYIGRVKYNEESRYVVEVCYSNSRPPRVMFYAIDKDTKKAYCVRDRKYKATYRK